MNREICITGMGVVNSVAKNVNEFKEALETGKHGFGKMQTENSDERMGSISVAAKIKDFSIKSQIEEYKADMKDIALKAIKLTRHSSFSLQTTVACTLEAWRDAGLHINQLEPERIGVVIGGSNISQYMNYQMFEKYKEAPEFLTPSYALAFMDTNHLGTVSELFQIKGEGFTVGGASASGNVALIQGYRLIKMGIVDACIVVGALTELSPVEFQAFKNLGAIGGDKFKDTPEQASRPFDENHSGFIYGEGAGCIILESEESARKRNAKVHAKMLSGAMVLDGNHLSDARVSGEVVAMEQAIAQSGVDKSKIGYVNAHGTSTPLGDQVEADAIKTVFEKNLDQVAVNSTKGIVGHCLYSAGILEAVASVIQMENSFVHGNRNLFQPIMQDVNFCKSEAEQKEVEYALNNSFGFGGINTSILLGKGDI